MTIDPLRSGFLASVRQVACRPATEIAAGAVILLAPHPDDETLGCGQLIAALSDQNIPVQVVVVTDGAASHPRSRLWPPARLAQLRAGEVARAVAILGSGRMPPPVMLGYPDLAAPDDPPRRAEAAERIAALITAETGTLLSPWAGDPHPDHQRVARIARIVAARQPDLRHLAYPVWGRFEPAPATTAVIGFDDPGLHLRKARALAAHRSQMSDFIPDDPEGFVMPAGLQRHFITHPELFIDAG